MCTQEGPQAASSLSGSSQPALASLLHQLELMACTEASSAVPASLQPVVQHTLDCISGAYQQPPDTTPPDPDKAPPPSSHHQPSDSSSSVLVSAEEEPVALDEAWLCLAELLCDEDSWALSVGESWLYRLLVEAAEQHMQHPQQQQEAHSHQQGEQYFGAKDFDYPTSPGRAYHREAGQVGLLPHPLGCPPKPDAPAHLSNQPQLSQLLRRVLAYSSDRTNTGLCFMRVVRRLLMHLKLKCSLSQSMQHQREASGAEGASSVSRVDSKGGRHRHSVSAEDLLASTADPGMRGMHDTAPEQGGSSLPPKASASDEAHPLLMHTSPALDWGKSPQPSRSASDAHALDSDDGQSAFRADGRSEVNQSGMSHHRTQSDPRGMFHTALSTAGSVAALGGESEEGPGQGNVTGPGGAAPRALSSVLSTAELTGFFQEPDKQEGAIVTHEGIVLHDAPLLGHSSPETPAEPAGTASPDCAGDTDVCCFWSTKQVAADPVSTPKICVFITFAPYSTII